MASKVEQLATWMVNRAEQQGLTVTQCKNLTIEQVYANLPEQYKSQLRNIIFLKAKRMMIQTIVKQKLEALRDNTTIRQEVLNIFPDATFGVIFGVETKIVIKV